MYSPRAQLSPVTRTSCRTRVRWEPGRCHSRLEHRGDRCCDCGDESSSRDISTLKPAPPTKEAQVYFSGSHTRTRSSGSGPRSVSPRVAPRGPSCVRRGNNKQHAYPSNPSHTHQHARTPRRAYLQTCRPTSASGRLQPPQLPGVRPLNGG